MKNKTIPVFLIILPFALLAVLLTTRTVCGGTHGFLALGVPAYFVEEVTWGGEISVTTLQLKIKNIMIMHALLSVPIFISGYLWAKSKKKNSEPGNREVRETPAENLTE